MGVKVGKDGEGSDGHMAQRGLREQMELEIE
jgi:hypothetical protein